MPERLLPVVETAKAFGAELRGDRDWSPAIAAIAQRHRLGGSFARSETGSTAVFLSARWCIKLHPPVADYPASERRERVALQCVEGRLDLPTPRIEARGELEGWPYFVATRLPGRAVDEVWPSLPEPERRALAARLGRAVRQLHEVDATALASVTEPWSRFRPAQRQRCLDLERGAGLGADRLEELAAYLDGLDRVPDPTDGTQALLHTELGPSHVLVEGGEPTGLIDFGDAMVGEAAYDLAPVGMFITRGDRGALTAFCRAYGLDAPAIAAPHRVARWMRHCLLHRYGTLAWYERFLSPPPGSIDSLASHWFGADLARDGP